MAVGAVEATFVPTAAFANHFLSFENNKSAAWAASSVGGTSTSNDTCTENVKIHFKSWKLFEFEAVTTYAFNVDSPLVDKVGECPYPKPFGPNKRP